MNALKFAVPLASGTEALREIVCVRLAVVAISSITVRKGREVSSMI